MQVSDHNCSLIINKRRKQMPINAFATGRIQGVLGTFVDAVNAFNDNDWDTYKNYLDQNVVAYNLSVIGYTLGRDNVVNYFRGISDPKDKLNLQFQPTPNITWFPSVYPQSVWGVALWTHKANGHVLVPINYEFQFYPGSFLLTSVWAQHLIGD
jgi:hypothetical protein